MSNSKIQFTVEELTVRTIKNMDGAEVYLAPYSPAYVPVYAGVSTAEEDADASVAITVSGVLATDVAKASLVAATTAQAITKVVCTADTVTVTLAGNGGVGTQVFYEVFRAV